MTERRRGRRTDGQTDRRTVLLLLVVYAATPLRLYAQGDMQPRVTADRNEAIRLKPDWPEAYVARGGTFHQLGMHEQGLADRTEAIRLAPDLPEAWLARGNAYYLLGDYKRAMDDLSEAVRLRPNYEDASMLLAKAQHELTQQTAGRNVVPPRAPAGPAMRLPETSRGDTVAAETSASEVVAAPEQKAPVAKPAPPPVKKVVEPKPVIAKAPPVVATPAPVAKATTSGTAEQHHQRGRDLIQQKKYREAIEELSEALRQQPELALAYNARGYAYALLRDFPHAIADYDAAIRINPKYINAYQNRRAARQSSGDKAGAAADAEKLREFGK